MHWKRSEPVYMQVVNEMKNNISGQHWAPGTLLPNEFELARQYGISRSTLRNAMALLESEGYIIRRKFSGTVVAPDALRQKYEKLDIAFVSQMELETAESFAKWVNEPYQLGMILREAVKKGYFVRFIPWLYSSQKNYYELDEIIFKKAIDAFIVASPLYATDFLDELANNKIPHVALESYYDRSGVNTVMFDEFKTAQKCFETLYGLGHRKIGLIAGLLKVPQFKSHSRCAKDNFLELQQEFGLSMPEHWLQAVGEDDLYNHPVDNIEMVKAILRDPQNRPTAIICATERIAHYLYRYCEEHQIKVPLDLSIISLRSYVKEVKISSYMDDLDEITKRTYTELVDWLKTPSYRPKLHLIEKKLNNNSTLAKPKS